MSERRPWFIDGISQFMGFRYRDAGVLTITVREELLNAGGLLSGVVPFALVDYAMGSALWQQTTDEEGIATLNIALNFIATARVGEEVVCRATVDRRNRSSAVLRAEVATEDGRLLGTAIGSYSIFRRDRYAGRPPEGMAPAQFS